MPPEELIPTESLAPAKKQNVSKYFLGVLILGILVVAAITIKPFFDESQVMEENIPKPFSIDGRWFQSNIKNIRFSIPEGWTFLPQSNIVSPLGDNSYLFVLQKTGTTCVIAAPKEFNREEFNQLKLKQISWANRVFSNYWQFDGNWYVASTSDALKYSFSQHNRQYLTGEFRFSSSGSDIVVILFTSDGSAVPDDCNNDMNTLLQTLEPYYERVNLSSASDGLIISERVMDNVIHNEANKSYDHLLFIADGSEERREVMHLPKNTWANGFHVYGNNLYVPAYKGQYLSATTTAVVYKIDPFSKQTMQIPGVNLINSFISSIFIHNGTLYYLATDPTTPRCLLDGYKPCPSTLYSIPLSGGNPKLIGRSSTGGLLQGYIESEGAFYITRGFGDGGCLSNTLSRIIGGQEELVEKIAYCEGDGEEAKIIFNQKRNKINEIIAQAKSSKIISKGLKVKNGTLIPNDTTEDTYNLYPTVYFEK